MPAQTRDPDFEPVVSGVPGVGAVGVGCARSHVEVSGRLLFRVGDGGTFIRFLLSSLLCVLVHVLLLARDPVLPIASADG